MIRRIIHIDENKCNGCGACAAACHEGAIAMIDGKARLIRDDYCDGLGDCLPSCPAQAITFTEREAAPYDEAAVKAHMEKRGIRPSCPGAAAHAVAPSARTLSQLRQWPVQIKLVPVKAAYFDDADLLIAADCTAYAYARFHEDFISRRITLIGCPKLDDTDYAEKLSAIIRQNAVRTITVTRMEVPCCGGLEMAVQKAVLQSGKSLPLQVVVIAADGRIIRRTAVPASSC